jgi:hypothetical protein
MKPATLAVPPLRCFLIPPERRLANPGNLPSKRDKFATRQV